MDSESDFESIRQELKYLINDHEKKEKRDLAQQELFDEELFYRSLNR